MGKKTKDELLRQLIDELLRPMVERILEEKLRLDPHALDGIGTTEVDRRSFLRRMVSK